MEGEPGQRQHVVIVVDGGPKIITFIIDGVLCDGGDFRMFGWGRFSPLLRYLHSYASKWVTAPGTSTQSSDSVQHDVDESQLRESVGIDAESVSLLRVYDRILRTSEAVAHFKAGAEA